MIESRGKISISRVHAGDSDNDCILIAISDGLSGARVVKFRMSFEKFSKAVTGEAYIPGDLTYFDDAPVGKKRERKEETVEIKCGDHDKEKIARLALTAAKKHEVDGWVASDQFNSLGQLNWENDKVIVKVNFVRYV